MPAYLSHSFHGQFAQKFIGRFQTVNRPDTEFSYSFDAFFHPLVHRLVEELNRRSLKGLLDPDFHAGLAQEFGVPVRYSELSNSGCLVELGIPSKGVSPELSYGTHFFLDLDGDVAAAVGGRGLPVTVAFDRDGVMVGRVFGELTEESLEALVRLVR